MKCEFAKRIFLAGVEAAKPEYLIPNFFENHPSLHNRFSQISNHTSKLFVLSLGKAGYTLAKEFKTKYQVHSCFVYTKQDHIPKNEKNDHGWNFILREGTHPIPSEGNVRVTEEIIEWMKCITDEDTLVVLLSGGGSSLLELPREPFSINDIIEANRKFLSSPLTIDEINTERKKFSRVKGGGLLTFLPKELSVITLALSDVLSDDPRIIASAPTYPGSDYFLIGNIKQSLNKAKEKAETFGYHCIIYSNNWDKDAKLTGEILAEHIKNGLWQNMIDTYKKVAILIGGEMVATVKEGGVGGRNQEAALSFAINADHFKLSNFCFLSAGTDGTDGPTNVAGACIDERTINNMRKLGYDPRQYLNSSNSYPILESVKAHIFTGPTGTNVNDLLVLLLETA